MDAITLSSRAPSLTPEATLSTHQTVQTTAASSMMSAATENTLSTTKLKTHGGHCAPPFSQSFGFLMERSFPERKGNYVLNLPIREEGQCRHQIQLDFLQKDSLELIGGGGLPNVVL